MPVTQNILLQAAAQAKTQAASAKSSVQPAEPGDRLSSFSQVYAKQGQNKSLAAADGPVKSARDKTSEAPIRKEVGNDKSAGPDTPVADSGKSLPAEKPAPTDDKTAIADAADAPPTADTAPVDPALDPSLSTELTTPAPAVPEAVVATPAQRDIDAALAAAAALTQASAAATEGEFDPEADPLDALPALRMAMEQGGHISATSQAQPKSAAISAQAQADGETTAAQNFAAGMAGMLDAQAGLGESSERGEKAFSGLIDDGLKDLKSATSDTRVDDFANRLASLTQAATPKSANAVPVNQPITMNQSGWTEEVVNRVMYLSSVNLKAADIQLQPAELGRLDIRVNMVPDQQTQVTFMSAHPSVREALDSQMHRLRDMFAQQGMGQVDVNVSDQSRGSQQGQEHAQHSQSGRTSTNGGRLDSMDDEPLPTVAEVATATSSVIGSSVVDYYA
ncbi:hypothetical protein PS645_04762 [Pseudomonas fluorescens]|uniref:Flagellar hook-length control protein-like C-terminal domain-containing protein n=1 Tax=Pseudomonas fluorescens TaxID=294 RepID=A0A5E6WP47_PSEFL|nr:flagellar hook-length control protein FliK [Pseudomonas fluorescens]VVN29701.1 hypothetical protein PS645_04762 [Pseudomonas fluorescens]